MQCISEEDNKIRNILIEIAFDGSSFHGWQIQNNAITVQSEFQKALERIVKKDYEIKGCSRTDSGVHANMFCISLKTSHTIPTIRLKSALNNFLPMEIVVNNCTEVPLDFHARYSCKSKEYIYKIWNSDTRNPFYNNRALYYRYPIDENLLNTACKHYIGTHDFTSFCTLDKREKGDFTRTIYDCSVTRQGDMITFRVVGNGFLYNMVRIMVGTLLMVQQGKISTSDIPSIIEKEDRAFSGPTAPPQGLYLNKVNYGEI